MVAEKFQIYSVKITGKKLNLFIFKSPQAKLSPWLSLPPRQKKITHPSQQRFLKTIFPQQKEGEDYGVGKITKIKPTRAFATSFDELHHLYNL